jgi:hypothetical protein
MQYMLLIYGTEAALASVSPADRDAMIKDFDSFTQAIVNSGNFRAGERLQRSHAATTVRLREGAAVTMDGPFAETREQLGGYYVIEAKDLDDAIAIAKRVPSVRFGGAVEIRPVLSPAGSP